MSETFNVYDDSIISGSWSEKKNMELGSISKVSLSMQTSVNYKFANGIASGNGIILIHTYEHGYYSKDGVSWSSYFDGIDNGGTLTFYKGYFYIFLVMTQKPYRSSDGINWAIAPGSYSGPSVVDYSHGIKSLKNSNRLVACGYLATTSDYIYGIIMYMTDSGNWGYCSFHDISYESRIDAAYMKGISKYIAFSLGDRVQYYWLSSDAITWTQYSTSAFASKMNLPASDPIWYGNEVSSSNDRFYLSTSTIRRGQFAFYSYDGLTWNSLSVPSVASDAYYASMLQYIPNFGCISLNATNGMGGYVKGTLIYSSDGMNSWRSLNVTLYLNFYTTEFNNCIYIVDYKGSVYKCTRNSTDLVFIN